MLYTVNVTKFILYDKVQIKYYYDTPFKIF